MATPPVVSTRDLVRQMVEEDPSVTLTAMAKAAGVSLTRVQQLLKELGYRRIWEHAGHPHWEAKK